VSDWATVFLGIIAAATLVTAVIQVAVLLAAGRLVRRIGLFVDTVEHDVKPVLGHLNSISSDASRAVSLATGQVERVDRLVTTLLDRLEETLETVRTAVGKPAREAAAVMAGLRAAMTIIREMREKRARARADEEDGLFI
jgi:hypothetical protein